MESVAPTHYDESYFAWQKVIGEFGAWANIDKFQPHISENDVVMDFGCGGGYLLKAITCQKRYGIEVSEQAQSTAKENGLTVFEKTAELEDQSLDVVISNNSLEHCLQPFSELREIHKKLKPGGKAVFLVPCETIINKYKEKDINHHLYSWSPMCIGNLFTEAGFHLISVKPQIAKWPPGYQLIAKWGGKAIFKFASEIYGRLDRRWYQVKVVAEKRWDNRELSENP